VADRDCEQAPIAALADEGEPEDRGEGVSEYPLAYYWSDEDDCFHL
jgi:hypothetical protein